MRRRSLGKLEAAVIARFKADPDIAEGCEPEDYWEDPVEVWPENWEALVFFVNLQTQWVHAMGGGRIGLRYEAVYPQLDRFADGDKAKWDWLFSEVRHMELVVLRLPMK